VVRMLSAGLCVTRSARGAGAKRRASCLRVKAVLPGLVEAELVADDDHNGVEQATAATGCPGQKCLYFALLNWKRLVGSHGLRRLSTAARRLAHGDDRTMRYVRGTPAADRPIARRWYARPICAVTMDDPLSRSRSASPATTGSSSDSRGISRTHQRCLVAPHACLLRRRRSPASERTTPSIRVIDERKRVTRRIKHEYNATQHVVGIGLLNFSRHPCFGQRRAAGHRYRSDRPYARVDAGTAHIRSSKTMAGRGRLLLLERLLPSRRGAALDSDGGRGRERTEAQYAALLAIASLTIVDIIPTRSPIHIIQARRT
jgi:hypothetical protein